jgi:hypothetical protein
MKTQLRKVISPLTLFVAVVFFKSSARCGDLHSGAVQVLPSQFQKAQPPSQLPGSNDMGRQGLDSRAGRASSNANLPNDAARSQSRSATRPQTADASGAGNRREDGVCTHGNPQLIGSHCSASSQCDWGARCVGVPAFVPARPSGFRVAMERGVRAIFPIPAPAEPARRVLPLRAIWADRRPLPWVRYPQSHLYGGTDSSAAIVSKKRI